ncbi:MAG: hypothetical protein SVY15_00005 [Halobacteriota archaeon]|nr:hypothetical protein [Halobacteriota archaeon]
MVETCLLISDLFGIIGTILCIIASFVLMAFSINFSVGESSRFTLFTRFLRFIKDSVVTRGQRYGYELLGLGFILILIDLLISFLCTHIFPLIDLI